jgi:hypothetical protein
MRVETPPAATPSEPAHVRTETDGGVGSKPGDRYAVPLCSTCHAKQHRAGEFTFWSALRIDPLSVALRLWTVSTDVEPGSALSSGRDNRSIWRRRIAERRTIPPEQIAAPSRRQSGSSGRGPDSRTAVSPYRHTTDLKPQ